MPEVQETLKYLAGDIVVVKVERQLYADLVPKLNCFHQQLLGFWYLRCFTDDSLKRARKKIHGCKFRLTFTFFHIIIDLQKYAKRN